MYEFDKIATADLRITNVLFLPAEIKLLNQNPGFVFRHDQDSYIPLLLKKL